MRPRSRMPQLAYPFAIVGFAAGWLSDGLLANPLVGVAIRSDRVLAAVIAALVGAALGAFLTWQIAPPNAYQGGIVRWHLVIVQVLIAGLVTGGAVGGLERDSMYAAASGALNGALSAIGFVPVCALVLVAARRAERARLGSIVAGADRRAVWGILAAALSVTTLAALPDWPAARYGAAPVPHAAVWMAAGAGGLLLCLLLADVIAIVRIARIPTAGLEPHEISGSSAAEEIPAMDMGLGDQVMARLARGNAAYRSRARAVALLLGSVADARAALGRAVLRGVAGVLVVIATLGLHRWAAGPFGLVAYNEVRCVQGDGASCYRGGLLWQGEPAGAGALSEAPSATWLGEPASAIVPPDTERAEKLFLEACDSGQRRGCVALVASLDARGAAGTVALPYWFAARAPTPARH